MGLVDALGQDVWIIELRDGWGHQWFVGEDHTQSKDEPGLWATDFEPDPKASHLKRVCGCKGRINFKEKWFVDPRTIDKTIYKVVFHLTTNRSVDVQMKEIARKKWNTKPYPSYCAGSYDCRHYASGLAGTARYLQWKDAGGP